MAAGLLGGLLLWVSLRPAFPAYPESWSTSRREAEAIALERLRDVGLVADDPTFTTRLEVDTARERRLRSVDAESLADGELARLVAGAVYWSVIVYEGDQAAGRWSYRARVSAAGRVLELRRNEPPDVGAGALSTEIFPFEVLLETAQFLDEQDVAVEGFGEPQLLRFPGPGRVDRRVSYRLLGNTAGELVRGVDVHWAGGELLGFRSWVGDPEVDQGGLRVESLLAPLRQLWIVVVLLPVLGHRIARRRDRGFKLRAGSWRVFVGTAALGSAAVLLSMRSPHGAWLVFDASWSVVGWSLTATLAVWVLALAWLAQASWSMAVHLACDPWASRLISFRALTELRWRQSVVGESCLRGVAAGLLLSGSLLVLTRFLPGASTLGDVLGRWWQQSSVPGVTMAAFQISLVVAVLLFHLAFLLPLAVRAWGSWPGATLVAVLLGLALGSPIELRPLSVGFGLWVASGAASVVLALRYDLLTALVATTMSLVATAALPFLQAQDAALQLQGWIAVAAVSLPLVISLREVGKAGEEELAPRTAHCLSE